MNRRKMLPLGALFFLLFSLLPLRAGAAQNSPPLAKVEPLVLEQVEKSGRADFFVWMAEKADLSLAAQMATKAEKGRFVYETLVATADRTQRDLRQALDRQGASYEAFYIANKILVRGGDAALLVRIAARPDVARITANHTFQLQEPPVEPAAGPHPNTVEPNLSFIKADQVWAMGITGRGTVLAGNDTGILVTHPALARHYRGCLNPPDCTFWDHNYNWWDATGTYLDGPGDGDGHGTYTTGVLVGDDGAGNQIGMAPGAQMIHCKNMTDGGYGGDDTFSTCFQWDLAPWDLDHANPRPDLAPDAVNNSWGYMHGHVLLFEDEIAALQAAGIVMEFSSGNEGISCFSLRSPADYEPVLTTGSVSYAGPFPGAISDFSSRGPSMLYPDAIFPDVMAPGENIRSSTRYGDYGYGYGTSIAGPHTTGLVGLIWSANPALRGQVEVTQQLIRDTAVPLTGQGGTNCGGDYINGPNNDWGYGTIDALAAVQAAIGLGRAAWLDGTVVDAASSQPVEGATVRADNANGLSWSALSNTAGYYTMTVAAGTYTVTAQAFGYDPAAVAGLAVISNSVTTHDFYLQLLPAYVLSGTVIANETGNPLGAEVEVPGTPLAPVWSNPVTGYYSLTVPSGSYTLLATALPLPTAYQDVVADHDRTVNLAIYQRCDIVTATVENGPNGWTPGGDPNSWAITTEDSHSPSHSWTDSPGGPYGNYGDAWLVSPAWDLSGYGGVVLSFWHRYDIDNRFDFGHLEYSLDGATWHRLVSFTGNSGGWRYIQGGVSEFDNQPIVQLRFRLLSDDLGSTDGWYLDDLVISGGGPGCLPPPPEPPDAGFSSNSPVFYGQTGVFTNTSSGTPPLHYTWAMGDGTVMTATNPVHLYPAAGSYTVTLLVTNTVGSDSISRPFVVECGPVSGADFDWTPLTPTLNAVVALSGTANSPAPVSYEWDFGDGTLGSGQYVTHSYAVTGTVNVAMTATSDCGSQAGADHALTIVPPPPLCEAAEVVTVTAEISQCAVSFTPTVTGTAPFSYLWSFGDGMTATVEFPTHSYTQTGSYTVALTAANCGGASSYTLPVDVSCELPPPCDAAEIVGVTAEVSQCTVVLAPTVTGTAPFGYLWAFGDGTTSTVEVPTHSYTQTGSYIVALTVTNCGGPAGYSLTVEASCAVPPRYYYVYLPIIVLSGQR